MTAKLVAEEGPLKGLILLFEDSDQWIIGRDPDSCQLLIEDPIASRRHLICRTTPEGIVAQNLSNTNPLLINNKDADDPQILQDGDILKIGSGLFRFRQEKQARLFNEKPPTVQEKEPPKEESREEIEPEEGVAVEEEPEEIAEANEETKPEEKEESLEETEPEEEPAVEEEPEEIAEATEETKSEEKEESLEETEPEEEPAVEAEPEKKPVEKPQAEFEEIFSEEDLTQDEAFNEAVQSRKDTLFDEETAEEEILLADIDFDTLETGRWLLKVISGPNTGAEFTMRNNTSYLLGTDSKSCDVVFNDTSVSRQHARIMISEEDILTIEDLKSRNGTLVDGQRLETRHGLESNIVVNIGTSAFVIFDREGEMHTIISPLLPSIVNVLKQEESPLEEDVLEEEEELSDVDEEFHEEEPVEKNKTTLTAFILIAIITGTFVLMGIGMVTLFRDEPIEIHSVSDTNRLLEEALAPFPGVEYTFNKTTGTLMIVGHVLTDNARRQLRYNLAGLKFIKNIDDTGIVIDEKVWQELNPILARNPAWRGVTLQANAPGKFVLTGYLKSRKQMATLVEYMTANFRYLDHLQYRVVVEEELVAKTRLELAESGFQNINVSVKNGDVILQGIIPTNLHDAFEEALKKIASTPGVRNIQDFVSEVKEARSTIDITDRYLVTGVSRVGGNVSVVIDGKIVSKGDILDGMTITEITPQAVFLDKDNVNYRIDLRP